MAFTTVDFDRWALVAPNDDTGLGRMAQDFKSVLPVHRHFVAVTGKLPHRPLRTSSETLLDPLCSERELTDMLHGLHGVVFFETPTWHPLLLRVTRKLGVRTICVPMWEWFRGLSPQWQNCDFFACANRYSLGVVRGYGFANSAMVPWTLDLQRFPARSVSGPAKLFVHNAGLVDPDDRKGTADAIAAFGHTDDSELRLIVRAQSPLPFAVSPDPRIAVEIGNHPDPSSLYRVGDALIQPSKLEGMGFMVLEGVVSGLPVITQDAPPMNEWVHQSQLLARPRRYAYQAYSSAWIEHSHIREPNRRRIAAAIRWASQHDVETASRQNREWAEATFGAARLRAEWEQTMFRVLEEPSRRFVEGPAEPRHPGYSMSHRLRRRFFALTGLRLPVRRLRVRAVA
jgi:glycosyltransferase involved in cell wall biosynthesis